MNARTSLRAKLAEKKSSSASMCRSHRTAEPVSLAAAAAAAEEEEEEEEYMLR